MVNKVVQVLLKVLDVQKRSTQRVSRRMVRGDSYALLAWDFGSSLPVQPMGRSIYTGNRTGGQMEDDKPPGLPPQKRPSS